MSHKVSSDNTSVMKDQKLGLFGTVALGFFWISGGFYCAEPIIQTGPTGYVFITMLFGAFLFGLPLAFISAESATMYPENGGYIQTIRVACGETIGIHVAYWMSIMECIDAVSYPVLAVTVLQKYFPVENILICKLCLGFPIIIGITLINLKGTYFMSQVSTVIFLTCFIPSALFIIFGLQYINLPISFNFQTTTSQGNDADFNYAFGLSVVLWLYSGAINLGVLAGEVKNPYTTFLSASLILIPLVATVNLLPVMISTSIDDDASHYQVGYYREISKHTVGTWFPVFYDIGTIAALIGLYNSATVVAQEGIAYLMESSRNPFQQILESYDAMEEEENILATKTPGHLNIHLKWWERLLFAYPRRRHHIVKPLKSNHRNILPLNVMLASRVHSQVTTPSIEGIEGEKTRLIIDNQYLNVPNNVTRTPPRTRQRSFSNPLPIIETTGEIYTNDNNTIIVNKSNSFNNGKKLDGQIPYAVNFDNTTQQIYDSAYSSDNENAICNPVVARSSVLPYMSEPMPTEGTRRNKIGNASTELVNFIENLQEGINHVADIMAQRRIYVLLNLIIATTVFFLADFEMIIEVDMIIASTNTICMILSFLWVRKNKPEEHRPFKIPGGVYGCIICAVCPLMFIAMYLYLSLSQSTNRILRLGLFFLMISFGLFVHLIWKIFHRILQANVKSSLNRVVSNYGTLN